ncbi:MAG: hypothetical protein AAF491_11195 [Verrucomicrobiota bacterium]
MVFPTPIRNVAFPTFSQDDPPVRSLRDSPVHALELVELWHDTLPLTTPSLSMKLFLLLLFLPILALSENQLEPLMVQLDEPVLEMTFEKATDKLDREHFQKRQATRWEIANGVLAGIPSSPEIQAAKSHHRGLEPRLSVPATPEECAAKFSIRFLEGEETTIVPFIEFGHHIIRLRFSASEGVALLADYESLKVAEDPDFRYLPGEWIHLFAELKGTEFVIQIQDGPTLYAKHPIISEPAPSGGTGLGVAGTRGGTVELDDLTIWTVKPDPLPEWTATRAEFPAFEPVQVREKPKKV